MDYHEEKSKKSVDFSMASSVVPIIALTMGDPAGIGPELVILGTLRFGVENGGGSVVVIGDLSRLEKAAIVLKDAGRLSISPQFVSVTQRSDIKGHGRNRSIIYVVDLANVPSDLPWGIVSREGGRASYEYVECAVKFALSREVDAICTAPIHKKAWQLAEVPFPGHTEALARLSGADQYAMMLRNQRLRVVHCTTHIPFADIVACLTAGRIVTVSHLGSDYLQRIGVHHPRIAVAGLNPHAGDERLFGTEEATIIYPAIEQLQKDGLLVTGPWPADTVFARAADGEFDMVVALYHDQGHIAIKMLGIETGVNETIGLPIIRTSVDHGTAFDIAGGGFVRETSVIYGLKAAIDDVNGWTTNVGQFKDLQS